MGAEAYTLDTYRTVSRLLAGGKIGAEASRITPANTLSNEPTSRRRASADRPMPSFAACAIVTRPSWGRARRRSAASIWKGVSVSRMGSHGDWSV